MAAHPVAQAAALAALVRPVKAPMVVALPQAVVVPLAAAAEVALVQPVDQAQVRRQALAVLA